MALNKARLDLILAYSVAAVSFTFGLIILFDWMKLQLPASSRYIFGFIMILLGIYRVSITRMKARQNRY